jgi:hypothetical protein
VGPDKHDGCAVLWSATRWRLLEAVHVDYGIEDRGSD